MTRFGCSSDIGWHEHFGDDEVVVSTRTTVEPSNFRVHLYSAEAARQCDVAMPVSERVREDHLCVSRLSSAGGVAIRYQVAWINGAQQCSKLDEVSVEVATPDEGIRSRHVVQGFEVEHAPSRETRLCSTGMTVGGTPSLG